MVRARHIMTGATRPFDRFDRNAPSAESRNESLGDLLATFAELRRENLAALSALHLTEADFRRRGVHPELGSVTLGELLATWVVHDLDHIAQLARTMAKAYTTATGPWKAYLSILRDREKERA